MCGIGGFIGAELSEDAATSALSAMGQAMRNRGPDDSGIYIDPEGAVGLVHRRLSIIDLSPTGHQPMTSPSGRFVIVFNGEIYNFELLRKELEAHGTTFSGTSDTEVLLHAVERWGIESALERSIGMFALALWDRQDRVLYLARDRLGEKPLCLARLPRGIAFASDFAAIRNAGLADLDIDPCALALYLKHAYVPAPYAIHTNCSKLLPGTITAIATENPPACLSAWNSSGQHGRLRLYEKRYWSIPASQAHASNTTHVENDDDLRERFNDLLREAIVLQQRADVPVGAFLSGGIDSSLICSAAQAVAPSPIKTFTMGFDNALFDESEYANAVATHLGTNHTCVRVTADDVLKWVPSLAESADEPFANPALLPTFLVSRIARQDVTVCLTGDGGDELFGGYNRYIEPARVHSMTAAVPRPLAGLLASVLELVPAKAVDATAFALSRLLRSKRLKVQSPGQKLHKLAKVISTRDPARLYEMLMSSWNDPLSVLANAPETLPPFDPDADSWSWEHFADHAMRWDMAHYLPDDNLTKVDRASMAVSLETRLPLLDHRIVEFAHELPMHLKIEQGKGKRLLRDALAQYLPEHMIDRPKMGFSVPIAAWLRGPLRDWAGDLLSSDAVRHMGLFDQRVVETCWNEHLSGRRDHNLRLWPIIQAHAWKDKLGHGAS